MECLKCGRDFPDGTSFCPSCGAPQFLVCKKCNSNVPTGQKFCTNCGHDEFEPPGEPGKIKDVY